MGKFKERVIDRFMHALPHDIAASLALSFARNFPGRFSTMMEQAQLHRLLNHYDIDCIFDVGANSGQYAEMLRTKALYKGRIISFEPIPALADLLRRKADMDGNWIIRECALSDRAGRMDFTVMRSDRFSSLGTPMSEETARLNDLNSPSHVIEVSVETLDSVFFDLQRKYLFKRPFLKLDTQGFDHYVLRGASSCVSHFRGIQSELAVKRLYKEALPLPDAIQKFKELGFELSAFVPNNEGHFPYLIETDGIFINTDLIESPAEEKAS